MVENLNSDENQNTANTTDGSENTAIEFTPEQQKHIEQVLIPQLRGRFSTQQSQLTQQEKTELETLRAEKLQEEAAVKQAEEQQLAEKGQYDELLKNKDATIEELRLAVVAKEQQLEADRARQLTDTAISTAIDQGEILPQMREVAAQIFRTGVNLDGQTYTVGVVDGQATIVDSSGNRVITASGEHLSIEGAMTAFGQQYPAFLKPTTVGGSGAAGSTVSPASSSVQEQYRKAQAKAAQTGREADLREAMRLRAMLKN